MKYFKTGNASRLYKKDKLTFEFERISYQSGSWLGVLAEPDEERAEVLISYGPPVKEITETEYNELKKKPNSTSHISVVSEPTPTEPEKPEEEVVPDAVENLEDELDFRTAPEDIDVNPGE